MELGLNKIFHKENTDTSFLYHGSPELINDQFMASETYFTIDKKIAKQYGKIIYSLELDEKLKTCFKADIFGEHLISTQLIPLHFFEVINTQIDKMELHIMFTDKKGKFHSIFKKWEFAYAEKLLTRIGAKYWEIGVDDKDVKNIKF